MLQYSIHSIKRVKGLVVDRTVSSKNWLVDGSHRAVESEHLVAHVSLRVLGVSALQSTVGVHDVQRLCNIKGSITLTYVLWLFSV